MKRRLFSALTVILVGVLGGLNVLAVSSTADTKPYIVEETYIPIEDHTFDNMGWLGMRALPPIGFSGIVYVDVKNDTTGDMETVQLQYIDMYMGGQWLDAGSYTIEKAYLATGNHFVVDLMDENQKNIQIEPGKKLNIEFVIRENPDAEEHIGHGNGIAKPTAGTEAATVPQQQPVPTETVSAEIPTTEETAPVESIAAEASNESVVSSASTLMSLVSAVAFVGVILLTVWLIRRSR